jgi:hypothetical protein
MRIGVMYELNSNAYYRALMPLRALERRGHEIVWPSRPEADVSMRDLAGCELVHCYRRIERVEDLRRLAQHGVAISFDNDDNYAAAQVSEGGRGLAGKRFNRAVFKRMVTLAKLADVTTTPSAGLADVYRNAGVKHVVVIENRLERTMPGFGTRAKHSGTVVGWVAGAEHSADLDRVPVTQALERLLEHHPDVTVLTVGLRLPLRSPRYEHIAEVPFPKLLTVTSRLDVGIAPLADIEFNRSRSDVKLREYSSGGAAWLASPVGPYQGLGEQQGGMLADDDGWFDALDHLVRNPRARKRLARRALKWAKRGTIDDHASAWEEAFAAAIARRGS